MSELEGEPVSTLFATEKMPPCLFFCTVDTPDDGRENDSTHLYHQSYPVYLSAFALSSSHPKLWPRRLQVLD